MAASSSHGLETGTQYRILSCNVAGSGDFLNLMLEDPKHILDQRLHKIILDMIEEMKNPESKITNEQLDFTRSCAGESYQALLRTAFRYILNDLDPDIICLQEFSAKTHDHQGLATELKDHGFSITTGRDTNIAFKAARFSLLESMETEEGATITDLMDLTTNKIIRVASDHVPGFNGKSLKEATALAKNLESSRVEIATAQSYKVSCTQRGDEGLRRTLEFIESDLLSRKDALREYNKFHSGGFFNKLKNLTSTPPLKPSPMPDAVIYAGDINATAKYVSEDKKSRLHPRRFNLLETAGYKFDKTDTACTIIDHNLKEPMKFDYIVAKAADKTKDVRVQSQTISTAGELKITLGDYSTFPSDHMPVIATVTLIDSETS